MRESVRDRDRLEHIIEAIDRILSFADGKTKEEIPLGSLSPRCAMCWYMTIIR
jgi:uncharacterized protein with HEPN domain